MSDSKFEYIDDVLLNVDKDKIKRAVRDILEAIGEDPDREKISHKAFSIVDLGGSNPLVWCELY